MAVPLFAFLLALGTAVCSLAAQQPRAVRGRLLTPDGGAPVGIRVRIGDDSATVDGDGRFVLWPIVRRGESVDLTVGALDGGSRAYQPVVVRVAPAADWDDVRIVLIPTRWTIARGSFAGRTVDIRGPDALGRRGAGNYWRVAQRGRTPGWSVAWSLRDRPIPVAFRTASGTRPIVSDSIAFWSLARELEAIIGDTLFRPASQAEIDEGTEGVLVEIDRRIRSAAVTYISWSDRGGAYDGLIKVQTPRLLTDARIVMHELMHALGFGHTTEWQSVMAPGSTITRPTLTDVAHAQLLFALHRLQEEQGAGYGVIELRR